MPPQAPRFVRELPTRAQARALALQLAVSLPAAAALAVVLSVLRHDPATVTTIAIEVAGIAVTYAWAGRSARIVAWRARRRSRHLHGLLREAESIVAAEPTDLGLEVTYGALPAADAEEYAVRLRRWRARRDEVERTLLQVTQPRDRLIGVRRVWRVAVVAIGAAGFTGGEAVWSHPLRVAVVAVLAVAAFAGIAPLAWGRTGLGRGALDLPAPAARRPAPSIGVLPSPAWLALLTPAIAMYAFIWTRPWPESLGLGSLALVVLGGTAGFAPLFGAAALRRFEERWDAGPWRPGLRRALIATRALVAFLGSALTALLTAAWGFAFGTSGLPLVAVGAVAPVLGWFAWCAGALARTWQPDRLQSSGRSERLARVLQGRAALPLLGMTAVLLLAGAIASGWYVHVSESAARGTGGRVGANAAARR